MFSSKSFIVFFSIYNLPWVFCCMVLIRVKSNFCCYCKYQSTRVLFLLFLKGKHISGVTLLKGPEKGGRGAAGSVLASERSPVGGCMWEVIQPLLLSRCRADITSAQRFLQPVPSSFLFFFCFVLFCRDGTCVSLIIDFWCLLGSGQRTTGTPTFPRCDYYFGGIWTVVSEGFTLTSTLIWPRCHHPGQSVDSYCGWCDGYFHVSTWARPWCPVVWSNASLDVSVRYLDGINL